MKALLRGLFLVPLVVAVVSAPAAAQSWKWDFGINGGYATFTSMLDEEDTGLPDEAGSAEVHFKPGFLVGTQLTFWLRDKLGLRLNGRWADRPLEGSDIKGTDGDFVTAVHLWGATADLMFRFKAPAAEFTSMEMLPYIALGAGAKWHNPALDDFTCNDPTENKQFNCGPFFTGLPSPQTKGWALHEGNSIAFLAGLGADWRLARRFAIRTEISDQIYKPKVFAATQTGATTFNLPQGDENRSAWTHEFAGQVGLHFLFGVAAPPVVAVAPPPAPPPPPPPPAAVSRESITVCVIDPTAPGGIRMQTATLVASRDTVISVGGTDRPFRESVGTITVASNAPWYVQGQPLTMTVGTGRVELAAYGSPRVIEAADLTFVGNVNGFPVYADRDDVADVISELNDLNRTRAGTDLGVLLNENRTLRNELADVKVFYVPMHATGCVFQAVQRQEEVRKGGK